VTFGKFIDKRARIVAAGCAVILVGVGLTGITKSHAFEAGQRWTCLTDQGEHAFLAVSKVEGEAVSFSWGTLKDDQSLSVLCNKRDQLSLQEIRQFCELLGREYSASDEPVERSVTF